MWMSFMQFRAYYISHDSALRPRLSVEALQKLLLHHDRLARARGPSEHRMELARTSICSKKVFLPLK